MVEGEQKYREPIADLVQRQIARYVPDLLAAGVTPEQITASARFAIARLNQEEEARIAENPVTLIFSLIDRAGQTPKEQAEILELKRRVLRNREDWSLYVTSDPSKVYLMKNLTRGGISIDLGRGILTDRQFRERILRNIGVLSDDEYLEDLKSLTYLNWSEPATHPVRRVRMHSIKIAISRPMIESPTNIPGTTVRFGFPECFPWTESNDTKFSNSDLFFTFSPEALQKALASEVRIDPPNLKSP